MNTPPPASSTADPTIQGSWTTDVQDALRRSRRLGWTVAATASGAALLEALALTALAPLKTVVPITISVDRATGYVETMQPRDPNLIRTKQ